MPESDARSRCGHYRARDTTLPTLAVVRPLPLPETLHYTCCGISASTRDYTTDLLWYLCLYQRHHTTLAVVPRPLPETLHYTCCGTVASPSTIDTTLHLLRYLCFYPGSAQPAGARYRASADFRPISPLPAAGGSESSGMQARQWQSGECGEQSAHACNLGKWDPRGAQ